jgi:PPM family protein phosphatase
MAKNYFGITDIGKVRSNNEDTFIAEPLPAKGWIVVAAIDGVGGYEGGEVAAEISRDEILKQLNEPFSDTIEVIKKSFQAANVAIYNQKIASEKNEQMACVATLALVDVANNKFYYGHVGDTRLYLLRDSSLVKISRDQSFVGFLEDSGKLNEHDAMNHPKRNEINKALGFDKILAGDYIETGESPFLPGDMLLLCSDGLTDMVDNATMTDILTTEKDLATKAKTLVSHANNAGGRDNITVVLAENDKPKSQLNIPTGETGNRQIQGNDVYSANNMNSKNESGNHTNKRAPNPKNRRVVNLLKLLFVLIIAALVWLVYQNFYNAKQHKNEQQGLVIKTDRNPQEQLLLDSIAHTTTGEVFVLNQAGSLPIIVSDSINVKNDTLHIIGNGVTIVADSSYKGPAFILSSNCKHIIFDSLTIQNFDVGVIANSKALFLRNVQFKNCRVPVQYQFLFKENELINERVDDSVLIRK